MTLYRATETCPDDYHIFDYGAHSATVDEPYVCLSPECGAALRPTVPVEPCEHGKIDPHLYRWHEAGADECPGAGIGGDDMANIGEDSTP